LIRFLTVKNIINIIAEIGLETCFIHLTQLLQQEFSRWQSFEKMPRIASHFPYGVIELMPIHDEQFYAYKYVNGHPTNPQRGQLTVIAMGMLAEVSTGYPLLISEMTLLTALRTAATAALASQYLARSNARSLLIIGTGSQAEFLVLALKAVLNIQVVYFFDIDQRALEKFARNLMGYQIELRLCNDVKKIIKKVDIIVTATAKKGQTLILENSWLVPGLHINGIGGDCPGKTELDPAILRRAKVVVEYLQQSKCEGEIQQLDEYSCVELWEIITGKKTGRESNDEVTVFDSVGFALEDYTVLKYFYNLSKEMGIGEEIDLIPKVDDSRNLFSLLCTRHPKFHN